MPSNKLPLGKGMILNYPVYGKCCKCGSRGNSLYNIRNKEKRAVVCHFCFGRVLAKLNYKEEKSNEIVI